MPAKLQKRPFSWKDAKETGISQYTLNKLVESGKVEKLAHGIYRASQSDLTEEDQYTTALMLIGEPSAICLTSALVWHNLTDAIPKKVWVMVEAHRTTHRKDVRLLRSRNPHWQIGIKKQGQIRVTNIDRTLIDCLLYRNRIGGAATAMAAIRSAISQNKTSVANLLKMAQRLKVKNRILPYLESLL